MCVPNRAGDRDRTKWEEGHETARERYTREMKPSMNVGGVSPSVCCADRATHCLRLAICRCAWWRGVSRLARRRCAVTGLVGETEMWAKDRRLSTRSHRDLPKLMRSESYLIKLPRKRTIATLIQIARQGLIGGERDKERDRERGCSQETARKTERDRTKTV